MSRCVVFALLGLISSPALAQVMYLPVRSQFSAGGEQHYFYGGNDPRVHAMARYNCRPYGYATNLHRFDGGNSFGQTSPLYDRTPVFTDCIPFQDASRFGYTAADAHNEAYANAARYFRKADQLAAAIVTPDGSLVVPPAPVTPIYSRTMIAPSTMPKRGQVIIIPKRLLDRPVKDFEALPKKVASAS